MSESWSPAPVMQFVASKTRLCALLVCRVCPPPVYQMVLGIDVPEHRRELEGGGLIGANSEIIDSAAACCLLDSSVEPDQQPCISARTVSTQAARDHWNRPRLANVSLLFHSSKNAHKLWNPPDALDLPARTAGCAATGEPTVCSRRAAAVRPNNVRAPFDSFIECIHYGASDTDRVLLPRICPPVSRAPCLIVLPRTPCW